MEFWLILLQVELCIILSTIPALLKVRFMNTIYARMISLGNGHKQIVSS